MTLSGPCELGFPIVAAAGYVGPKPVAYLEIQILNPESGAKGYHREFHTDALRNDEGLAVDEIEENKMRAVYGYVSWGWQGDDVPPSWTDAFFVNWTWTRFFPPLRETNPLRQNPSFVRIWLRNGVRADYNVFFNTPVAGQGVILVVP